MQGTRLDLKVGNQHPRCAIASVCPRCHKRERCWSNRAECSCWKLERVQRWIGHAPQAAYHAGKLAKLEGVCLRQLERQFDEVLALHPQEWLHELLMFEAQTTPRFRKVCQGNGVQPGFGAAVLFIHAPFQTEDRHDSHPVRSFSQVVMGPMSRNVASKSRFVVPPGLLTWRLGAVKSLREKRGGSHGRRKETIRAPVSLT